MYKRKPKTEFYSKRTVLSIDDKNDPSVYSYENYQRHEKGKHAICIYEGINPEGKFIWNGDRGQNRVMMPIFEKLLLL